MRSAFSFSAGSAWGCPAGSNPHTSAHLPNASFSPGFISLRQTSATSHLCSPNAWNGSPGSFSKPSAARVFPCERYVLAFSVGVTTNSSPAPVTSAANPPSIERRKNVLPARRSAAACVIWYGRSSNTDTPFAHVPTSASATGESRAPPAHTIASGNTAHIARIICLIASVSFCMGMMIPCLFLPCKPMAWQIMLSCDA